MKKRFLRRMVSLLLAMLLAWTAVPLPVMAAGEGDRLEDIASDCEITVPSEERPKENMVDGRDDTLWVNNGAQWPCTVEFKLPSANTKCVKKVVVKLESEHSNRSMDIGLAYALNNVTSDKIAVDGSEQRAVLSEGYVYEFDTPQAMSHLYITLTNPLTDGAAGAFWPAIAEVELYVDPGAQEEVVLQNLAETRAKQVTLEPGVDLSADKGNITDGDFETFAPLHTKTFEEIAAESGTLPFVEVQLDTTQKIRQFILAMPEIVSDAEYGYTIYGRKRDNSPEEIIASGKIGGTLGNRAEVIVSELENIDGKEVEYQTLKAEFTADNAAAASTIPKLAEFQILANQASITEPDEENIAWRTTDLHTNYNQDTVDRVVDGNTKNTWTATQYPAYVDIGLDGLYSLSEIEVYTPSAGYSQYSLYYSEDGQNYTKLARKESRQSCPEEGESWPADGVKASSVRILLEYHSESAKAVLNEVRIKGNRFGDAQDAKFTAPKPYTDSSYDVAVTEEDTLEEVEGIVSRNLGQEYVDWFTFALGEPGEYDYYDIEDAADGTVRITGNNGISLASGLNYYLKYYCNVSITQVGNQVRMPESIVSVGAKVHKECKTPVRYAYNYCTMSYSMPFWGESEWRKELDWLALNGVNLVLDITAQEEVWRQFLDALGYSHQEVKDYIAGPAYYAWAYMANLSGYGGPVHDSWFAMRTELARKNQLIMKKLGMQPILQGYSGMVPVDVEQKAQGEYALSSQDVIPQNTWCSFQRPYMLRTTSDAYDKYAALFYECQKNVYGDATNYYATDPFHEGGSTGNMSIRDVSSNILDSLLAFDKNAVWVIQAWQGNPSAELVNGLEGRKEHALILDLYADKTPHWEDPSYSGGKEFQMTPWVFCMLNNFGGRMGLHGHMDNLVSGVVKAANTSQKLTGIGITPEGSQNNPVLYDLLFETVWCDDARQPLEEIDTEVWLRQYVTRRYGAESENAYQAMRILEDTVYKASLNNLGQGAPESFINARPNTSIRAASTWGNAVISYDMNKLEDAAKLLLEDYEQLKESDGYLYDVADILKQALSNSSQLYHSKMVSALSAEDLDAFTEASDKFLDLIDKVEEVLGSRKEFLLGTWVEQAKALADGTDDFTKALYEFNAKALVTTWGAYPQAESGGLKDYSNRQWAGLTKDFYQERWKMWIDYQKDVLAGKNPQSIQWFAFEWEWARGEQLYTTEASNVDLKELGEDILENYSAFNPATVDNNDYPTDKIQIKEVGSQSAGDLAEYVLDNDLSTIWHTNWNVEADIKSYDKHYLVFELADPARLTGLRYMPRQEGGVNGIVTKCQVYTSLDGQSYELAAESVWAPDNSWKMAVFEEEKKAKFVKFVSKEAQSGEEGNVFTSAAEIRLTYLPTPVESIRLTSDKTELTVGESMQIVADILPSDATDRSLSWTSDHPEIVSVNAQGMVTAKAEGTAVITAAAQDGSGISGTITLKAQNPKLPILVESIRLTSDKTELMVGESVRITADVQPLDADDRSLSWTSDHPEIVSVNAQGTVTAKAEGTAVITAAAQDGSGISETITLKAQNPKLPVLVESIRLTSDKTELMVGESVRITADVQPLDADDRSLSWTSDHPEIVSVDTQGTVTAKAEGTAVITAKALDGSDISGTIILKAQNPKLPVLVESIRLTSDKTELMVGESVRITADVQPSDALNPALSWNSDHPEVAAVDGSGTVTAKAEGTAVITAAAQDGSGVTGSIAVMVKKPAGSSDDPGQTPQPSPQPSDDQNQPVATKIHRTKTLIFKVIASSASKKQVSVIGAVNKKAQKLTIPATVKIQGVTYQVTEISEKAFRKQTRLKQVSIGKKIQKIGKQAFDGCSRLNKITVSSASIKSIGKYAFRGIDKKASITVPSKKYTKYKRLLKQAKLSKNVKIKKKK